MATTKVITDLTEFNPGNPDYVLNATNAVTVSAASGANKYYFNGVYDGKFGLRIGTTVLTGIPSNHPFTIMNNGKTSQITISGSDTVSGTAPNGDSYTFYYNTATITVLADFGIISYACSVHGYMGGQDNLVSVYSEAGLRMPSSNAAYSGPTVAEGMMRNEVGQVSEGSASCMQHYTGDNVWKNFVNVAQVFTIDYLIVAGGGGGGGYNNAGGGGAGGLRTSYPGGSGGGQSSENSLSLSLATPYDVEVGPGGAGGTNSGSGTSGLAGTNSEFNGIISSGGGSGGKYDATGGVGGSGGGGGYSNQAGGAAVTSPAIQGYAGQAGASVAPGYIGGGAGGAGETGGTDGQGHGGDGLQVNIDGLNNFYAGGGSGGANDQSIPGSSGGGGNGGYVNITNPGNGTINTGGGGGGASGGTANTGGNGGSGVVILRYPTSGVSSYSVTGTLDTVTDTAYPIANTAYYKLDGNANDSAGSINGTWSGTETYAAGRFGQAASFNGSSKIDITGFANFGSTGVSISAWVYIDSFSNGPTIVNLYSNNSIVFGTTSTGQFFRSGAGPSVTSTSVMSTANWHHVVMSAQTNGDVILYLDGLVAGSGNATTQMYNDNNVSDLIGAYGTLSQPMNGKIDQVKIFNSPISASNVTSLYNEGTVIESTDGSDSILTFIGGTGTITFS